MKEALIAEVAKQVLPLVEVLLALMGTWVMHQLRLRYKSETASNILDRFERLAGAVVKELDQTIVQGLKARSSDGQLTKEEVNEVFTNALVRLEQLAGDKGMKELQGAFGDGQKAIRTLVEAKVNELRMAQASVPQPPPKLFTIPPPGGVL
jgi:hypothetical protein